MAVTSPEHSVIFLDTFVEATFLHSAVCLMHEISLWNYAVYLVYNFSLSSFLYDLILNCAICLIYSFSHSNFGVASYSLN